MHSDPVADAHWYIRFTIANAARNLPRLIASSQA
jgi:hypothetical protein